MKLSIAIEDRSGGAHVVALLGRLDTNTAPELDRELDALFARTFVRQLVFDLQGLEYVSSAGIRCFIRARKLLEPRHSRVALVGPRPPVRKVLEIVKAMPLGGIFSSSAELDAYLDDIQKKITSAD